MIYVNKQSLLLKTCHGLIELRKFYEFIKIPREATEKMNTKECSITNKAYQSSSRRVPAFKYSSELLNIREVNLTKPNSFQCLTQCFWWELKTYIRIQPKRKKRWKQRLTIKQLLEVLLFVIKM